MSEVLAGQVLHLQWNAYTSTWGPVLRDLRAAGLFHDLTLVTADNQLVTAHKIVLAACSQFFRGLLASLPMQTTGPLSPAVLYMRGVTGAALLKLLDFMYNGEVNVEQQLLKEFLQLGEELRVQGLCEEVVEKVEKVDEKSVVSKPKEKERKDGGGSGGKDRHRSYSGKEKMAHSEKIEKKSKSHKENVADYNDVAVERVVSSRKEFSERKALKREAEEGERKAMKREAEEGERKAMKREAEEGERKAMKREAEEGERKALKREAEEEVSVPRSEVELVESPGEELEMGHDKDDRMLGDKDRTRTPTPRKKIRKLKSLEELKDDTINRDVLTMDPGEAHGILKLIENLDDIDENSEDLNIFVQLLNQLILKSNIANNVLYFCGICQKSLKSKQHMSNHVEANHVVGVFHICSECGAKMKTRSSLFSHKNKNHKIQKKENPEVRGDLVQNKTELPTMADSLLTKADPVLNRPEFTQRKIEDVQNNFNDSINMSEHIDAHIVEEINHYSSEAEFE